MIEIEPSKQNGEQEIGNQDKLLTTTFQMEIENRKVEGLITYSTEQQIFKLKVNSGNNQELLGVNIQFTLYELKYTIHAILLHVGFHVTTENPNVMMRKITRQNLLNIYLSVKMIYILHLLHLKKF